MTTITCSAWTIHSQELESLLLRHPDQVRHLVRMQLEEEIAHLVPQDRESLEAARQHWLQGRALVSALEAVQWTEDDLWLHLHRPGALQQFARQRFGPGLEERFLAKQGAMDQIVYSIVRTRDAALTRELWIRLEEGETSFAEAASQYSQGSEAARKGVMGPLPIGSLQPPELAQFLRAMAPGDISAPTQLGEWHLLLRLEQLTPARFDQGTRSLLLQEQLDAFLTDRVNRRLIGEDLEPLHFHVDG